MAPVEPTATAVGRRPVGSSVVLVRVATSNSDRLSAQRFTVTTFRAPPSEKAATSVGLSPVRAQLRVDAPVAVTDDSVLSKKLLTNAVPVESTAMPLGGVKAWAKRTGTMWAGGAVGALVMANQADTADGSLEDAMKMGVYTVATDRRLLLVKAGGMRGLPVAALASIERARITAVEEGTTRVSLVKMVTMTVRCDDDTELGFEYPKPETNDARAVLAALGAN